MPDTAPEVRFVRALAAGVLRQGGEGDPAATAHKALREVLATQKSLVLDVQFTGFARRGEPVGGVDPAVLRAAGQLIVRRVNRIGFTPDATEHDLARVLDLLSRPPGELPTDGVIAAFREAAPRGVYLSTSTGEVYRPAPREEEQQPAPTEQSAATTEPPADDPSRLEIVSADSLIDLAAVELAEFELVETHPYTEPAAGEGVPLAPPPRVEEEPRQDDLYYFFRTSSAGASQEQQAETLPEQLRAEESLTRYDTLTEAAATLVLTRLADGPDARAIRVLDALVAEAQRPDRSRVFRESATRAIRRITTEPILQQLAAALGATGEVREQLVRIFSFLGREAHPVLEGALFRAPDPDLRAAIFRATLRADPSGARVLERAMADPAPARTRAILELATLPGVEPALTQRWLERAATHPDTSVRADVVSHAARTGGKAGTRILLNLLDDAAVGVRRAAVQGLGQLGDPAAVPFLARVLNESGDEELQLGAVAALGRIATPETLPILSGVLNRRQLFAGKRLQRLKLATLAAIGRIDVPGAREVLTSVAGGRDAELAAEAKRVLSSR